MHSRRRAFTLLEVVIASIVFMRPDCLAAQVNRELVGERHVRQADRQAGCILVVRFFDIR